jgi:hypothetical protein
MQEDASALRAVEAPIDSRQSREYLSGKFRRAGASHDTAGSQKEQRHVSAVFVK